VGDCTFHSSFTPHLAHSNDTEAARTDARQAVTDRLALKPGAVLAGVMFPRLPLEG
jgi:hypothetical protein